MATTLEINNLIDSLLENRDIQSDLASKVKKIYSSLLDNIQRKASDIEIKTKPIDISTFIRPSTDQIQKNKDRFNKIQQSVLKRIQNAVDTQNIQLGDKPFQLQQLLGEPPEATFRTNRRFQIIKRDILQRIQEMIRVDSFALNLKNTFTLSNILGESPQSSLRTDMKFQQVKRVLLEKVKNVIEDVSFDPQLVNELALKDLLGESPESSFRTRRKFEQRKRQLLDKIEASIESLSAADILKDKQITLDKILGETPANAFRTSRRFQQIKRGILEKIQAELKAAEDSISIGKINLTNLLGDTPENSFRTSRVFQQTKRNILNKIQDEIDDLDNILQIDPIPLQSIIGDISEPTSDDKKRIQEIKQISRDRVAQIIRTKNVEITDTNISLKGLLGITDAVEGSRQITEAKNKIISKITKQLSKLDTLIPSDFKLKDLFEETSAKGNEFRKKFALVKNKIIKKIDTALSEVELQLIKPMELDPGDIKSRALSILEELKAPRKSEEQIISLLERIQGIGGSDELKDLLSQSLHSNENLDYIVDQVADIKDVSLSSENRWSQLIDYIKDMGVSLDNLGQYLKTTALTASKKEKGLRIFEEDPTPVYLVKIHEEVWDKLERILGGEKKNKIENSLTDLGSVGVGAALLGGAALAAMSAAKWITDQDWPGVWKMLFRYFLDPKYRNFLEGVLDKQWVKFSSWFGGKWASFTTAITNRWGKVIDKVKDSRPFKAVEESFVKMGARIEEFKTAFKGSKLGSTIIKFTDKMSEMFKGIVSLFKIDPIADASKAADAVTGAVKGGSIAARIAKIGDYIMAGPFGKFVSLLKTGVKGGGIGAKIARGAFKMIPIFGDLLSILVGYNRIKDEGGILGWGQGVIDIVSGIIGLTGVGAPISVALDAVNLVIDLVRWGAGRVSEMNEGAKIEGYSGLWDAWSTNLAKYNKEFVMGIWSLLPRGARDFWEYDPATGWLKYREGALAEKWDALTDVAGLRQIKGAVSGATAYMYGGTDAQLLKKEVENIEFNLERSRSRIKESEQALKMLEAQNASAEEIAAKKDELVRLRMLEQYNLNKLSKVNAEKVEDAQGWIQPNSLVGFYNKRPVVTGARDFMTLAKEGGPIEKKLTELVNTVNKNMNDLMDKIGESIQNGIAGIQPTVIPIPPPVVNVPVNIGDRDLEASKALSYAGGKIYDQRAGFYRGFGG